MWSSDWYRETAWTLDSAVLDDAEEVRPWRSRAIYILQQR
jgi:hypothetical protein